MSEREPSPKLSRVHIDLIVEVDEEALARFKEEYPEFKDESPSETLVREAVAAWEWQALIKDYRLVGQEPISGNPEPENKSF